MRKDGSLRPRCILALVPWGNLFYAAWRVRAQHGHFRCQQNSVYLFVDSVLRPPRFVFREICIFVDGNGIFILARSPPMPDRCA